jgi:hypothetical protein
VDFLDHHSAFRQNTAFGQESASALAGDRRLKRQPEVPGKVDPGVLRHFGDEGVDMRPSLRLCIDRREMSFCQDLASDERRRTGVDEVVDDEDPPAIAEPRNIFRDRLQYFRPALLRPGFITGDAERFDDTHIEFARDDRRRHESAPRNRDDRGKRSRLGETPGQRARVAVKLLP